MFAIDLHSHTRFFHGFEARPTPFDPVGARLLTTAARWSGLDAVATTNHDYYRPFGVGDEALAVLPGIEVSTTVGHVLVVGPDPPRETPPGELTPAETVDIAHDRDCAAILAHPYRNSTVRLTDADVDAVEVNGKRERSIDRLERLAERLDVPLVGGSDAHYPFEVGRAYTVVDAPAPTPENVVDAIRAGDVEYYFHGGTGHRLLRRVYAGIHAYKGHEEAATERDRRSRPPEEQ